MSGGKLKGSCVAQKYFIREEETPGDAPRVGEKDPSNGKEIQKEVPIKGTNLASGGGSTKKITTALRRAAKKGSL